MDKLDRKKTITIKIDQSKEPYIEEPLVKKSLLKEVSLPSEETIHMESAATKEESFDWVLPNKETKFEVEEHPFYVNNKSNKKNKNGLNKKGIRNFFLAIIMAVVIGAGLWYFVLKTITASNNVATETIGSGSETSTGEEKENATVATVDSISLTFVQGGVFSEREAATKLQEELKESGLPSAIISQEGKSYVVLFTSDTIDHAKAISALYKEKGVDSFWKELTIGSAKIEGFSEKDSEVLAASIKIYRDLSANVTSRYLENSVNSEGLTNDLNELKEMKAENNKLTAAIEHLTQAVQVLGNDGGNESVAMQAQEHLLKYIQSVGELMNS